MKLLKVSKHPYTGAYDLMYGDAVTVYCELVKVRKSKVHYEKNNGSRYNVEEISLQALVDEYNVVSPFVAGIFNFENVDKAVTCAFVGNIIDEYVRDDTFDNELEFAKWLIDNIAYWNSEDGKEHFIQLAFYRRLTTYEGETIYILPKLEGHHDRNNKKAYISKGKN